MIRVEDIPGVAEHLERVRSATAAAREDEFAGKVHYIAGIKVRSMTVMDFLVLSRFSITSPIMCRMNPTIPQVAMFLWILQPEQPKWFRTFRAWMFGRRLRKTKVSVEALALECFAYIDRITQDAPSSSGNAVESCVSFLASWCHLMRETYKCSEQEVMDMPLPKLFQYLRSVLQVKNPGRPEGNKMVDDLSQKVCDLLRSGACTEDELMSGSYKMVVTRWNLHDQLR